MEERRREEREKGLDGGDPTQSWTINLTHGSKKAKRTEVMESRGFVMLLSSQDSTAGHDACTDAVFLFPFYFLHLYILILPFPYATMSNTC